MRAPRAFLSDVQTLIEEDSAVRAGIHAVLAACTLHRVDDNQAIIPLVDGPDYRAGLHAGGFIAVHAQMGAVSNLDLGHCPSHSLSKLQPELPGIRLRLGDRRLIIGDIFILADNLTAMAAVAHGDINHKNFF